MLGGSIKMVGRLQGTVGQSEMCLDLNHRGEKCSTPKKQEKQPSHRSKDSVLRNCSSQCLMRNQRMPKTETEMWLSRTTSCGTLKHLDLILPYSFFKKSWRGGWAWFCAVKLSPASQVMLRCILGVHFPVATGFGPTWLSFNCPGNTKRTLQKHPEDNTTAPG